MPDTTTVERDAVAKAAADLARSVEPDLWTPELAMKIEELARAIAREELASLSGLVLRRLQGVAHRSFVQVAQINEIFGEALRDFGGTEAEPGPSPEAPTPTNPEDDGA